MRTLAKFLVVISSLVAVAPRLVYAADSYPIATEFFCQLDMPLCNRTIFASVGRHCAVTARRSSA